MKPVCFFANLFACLFVVTSNTVKGHDWISTQPVRFKRIISFVYSDTWIIMHLLNGFNYHSTWTWLWKCISNRCSKKKVFAIVIRCYHDRYSNAIQIAINKQKIRRTNWNSCDMLFSIHSPCAKLFVCSVHFQVGKIFPLCLKSNRFAVPSCSTVERAKPYSFWIAIK